MVFEFLEFYSVGFLVYDKFIFLIEDGNYAREEYYYWLVNFGAGANEALVIGDIISAMLIFYVFVPSCISYELPRTTFYGTTNF